MHWEHPPRDAPNGRRARRPVTARPLLDDLGIGGGVARRDVLDLLLLFGGLGRGVLGGDRRRLFDIGARNRRGALLRA